MAETSGALSPAPCLPSPLLLLSFLTGPPSLPIPSSHPFLSLFLSLWVSLKGQVTFGHPTQPLPSPHKALFP